MYNQRDSLQAHTYTEATKLAAAGEEIGHLVGLMEPEYAMRIKIFVQQLPDNIRNMTIYGRSVAKAVSKSTKKK
jgi:hypothetical protein